jgi:hypothetical protein
MSGFPDDVRAVLRALAEARDGPFYNLYVDLSYAWPGPSANIGFRIYQVGDSPDVWLGVSTSIDPPNGLGVDWSVFLRISIQRLSVEGAVEVNEDAEGNVRVVFSLNSEAATASEAASLIRRFSEEVCAQRAWIGYPGGPS